MMEPLLLHYVDNVLSSKKEYCVMCLRTGDECRLLPPAHLNQYCIAANQPLLCHSKDHKVCYMCDRLATTALRFHLAVGSANYLAASVLSGRKGDCARSLYTEVYNHKTDMDKLPLSFKVGSNGHYRLRAALNGEKHAQAHRLATQLVQSDVLCVSSHGKKVVNVAKSVVDDDLQSEASDGEMYVLPDAAPPPPRTKARTPASSAVMSLSGAPDKAMDTVIIFDDDGPASTPAPPSGPPAPPSGPPAPPNGPPLPPSAPPAHPCGPPNLVPLNRNDADYVYHPIILNNEGVMTLPSLKCHISDGKLVLDGNPGHVSSNTYIDSNMTSHAAENVYVVNSVVNFDTNVNVAGNAANTGKVVYVKQVKLGNSAVNLANNAVKLGNSAVNLANNAVKLGNSVVNLNNAEFIGNNLVNISNSDATNVVPARNVTRNLSNMGINQEVVSAKSGVRETSGAGQAGPSLDIDWEAKIPMDLISFVNSDECLSKRARIDPPPPLPVVHAPRDEGALGFISSVTSLRQDDVIDLC